MTEHNIDNLIGNTPIIKIKAQYKENIVNIYAKLEYFNYTGSIKDRLALYIIKDAKKNGILKEGMPIIEATSGNTGISFASLGAYYNHPVHIFIPDTASIERITISGNITVKTITIKATILIVVFSYILGLYLQNEIMMV